MAVAPKRRPVPRQILLWEHLKQLAPPLDLQHRNAEDSRRLTALDEWNRYRIDAGPEETEGLLMTSDCSEPLRLHTMRMVDLLGAPELSHDMYVYLDGYERWVMLTPRQKAVAELWKADPLGCMMLRGEYEGMSQARTARVLHCSQSKVSRHLKQAHEHLDQRTAYWKGECPAARTAWDVRVKDEIVLLKEMFTSE
jgi:hypothetical protein